MTRALSRWLSVDEVAELLGVSRRTVYELKAQGRLPYRAIVTGKGNRPIVKFSSDDLGRFMEDCAVGTRR